MLHQYTADLEPIPCVQLHRDHGRPTLVIRPYREHRPPGEIFAAERSRLVFHAEPDAPTDGEWGDV